MARKQRLHLTLSADVVEELDKKDNISGFVDETLREELDL
jgi:hypothetical protein